MVSFNTSFRPRMPVRARGPVFAVGRRVYVASARDRPACLTSTDDGSGGVLATLADGTEVEIVAWRPRSSGTRYRVRSTRAGVEGWLAAVSVRCAEPTIARSGRSALGEDAASPAARRHAASRKIR
jgi:hypothetical protein